MSFGGFAAWRIPPLGLESLAIKAFASCARRALTAPFMRRSHDREA
jgi:hypothetical protein